jgi:hypothetical protein
LSRGVVVDQVDHPRSEQRSHARPPCSPTP